MKRKLLQKLVPGLCASLVLVSATSLTGCSTDTKTAATASDADKSETVYVKADASGTIHEIKVQTDLKNNGTSKEIKDFSTLKDIKNTKGNESFTQSSDGTITWENKGEDIHYEGTSTEELPVNVKISYTLDGKSIQPEDLSGKSGKLGIRFDYKNTTEENVTINGEEMTSPVPFAVISAMILPEDTASNIQVTNGKIFTMNDQSVVVGYACPGLKDSLKLTDYEPTEDISIPESVEVTADVTDFEMDFTATVVSSGLFEDLEEDSFDDMEDAADSLQELGDASGKLADGAAQLLSGASTYQNYLGQYVDGISQLAEGTDTLDDGVTALNENSGKLVSGASSLQNGLEQLNSALSGHINTDSSSIPSAETVSSLQEQIKSLSQQLDSVDSSFAEAKSSFASVNWDTLKSSITEDAKKQSKTAATDAVQSAIDQIVSETASDSELSEESKNAVNDKMSQLKNEINDTIASAIDQNLDLSSSTTDIDQLKSATEGTLNSLTELIASCHTTLDQMSSGAGSFAEATQSLSSLSKTLETLQNSLSALSAGSLQLTQGLTSFQHGIEQLSEGSSTLSQGATKLGTTGKELKEGYTTLAEGISSLSEGLTLFDKEGIQELEKLGGDDLKNLSKRMKAVKEADAEYDNYGGKLEEQTGEVRFIIETDGIDK
ncbi:chromosome segregation protein [[Ruminococcus] torques]|uniref:Chromosome segregation protein n=1 Tax=[Ruminococcus] torques TaxID=33039 RepID=A0A564URI0_9FIRM|nr:hypothetical protein [[Ruminococcus] torques]VUX21852.1 chromosome segregation protein [[Ruminococcus] torques]